MALKKHYVYFIKCCNADGFVKVGVSSDIESRISSLSTGNPYRLELVNSITCISKERAYFVEHVIHNWLSSRRISGEWFDGVDFTRLTKKFKGLSLGKVGFDKIEGTFPSLDARIDNYKKISNFEGSEFTPETLKQLAFHGFHLNHRDAKELADEFTEDAKSVLGSLDDDVSDGTEHLLKNTKSVLMQDFR